MYNYKLLFSLFTKTAKATKRTIAHSKQSKPSLQCAAVPEQKISSFPANYADIMQQIAASATRQCVFPATISVITKFFRDPVPFRVSLDTLYIPQELRDLLEYVIRYTLL